MSRCVVKDRRRTQSGGRREYSAEANDSYIGSLINTNSNVTKMHFFEEYCCQGHQFYLCIAT